MIEDVRTTKYFSACFGINEINPVQLINAHRIADLESYSTHCATVYPMEVCWMHKCVESTPVRIQAEKRIDTPKNVRRNGSGKRDDECQNGISEPVSPFSAEIGG